MILVSGIDNKIGVEIIFKLLDSNICDNIIVLAFSKNEVKNLKKNLIEYNLGINIFKIKCFLCDIDDIVISRIIKVFGIKKVYIIHSYLSVGEYYKINFFYRIYIHIKTLVCYCILNSVTDIYYISSIYTMNEVCNNTIVINENSMYNNKLSSSNNFFYLFRSEMEIWKAREEGVRILILNVPYVIGIYSRFNNFFKFFKNIYSSNIVIYYKDIINILFLLDNKGVINNRFIIYGDSIQSNKLLNLYFNDKNKFIINIFNKFFYFFYRKSNFYLDKKVSFLYDRSLIDSIIEYKYNKIL